MWRFARGCCRRFWLAWGPWHLPLANLHPRLTSLLRDTNPKVRGGRIWTSAKQPFVSPAIRLLDLVRLRLANYLLLNRRRLRHQLQKFLLTRRENRLDRLSERVAQERRIADPSFGHVSHGDHPIPAGRHVAGRERAIVARVHGNDLVATQPRAACYLGRDESRRVIQRRSRTDGAPKVPRSEAATQR